MVNDELKRVAETGTWYLKDMLDFDKKLIFMRYKIIKGYFKGPFGLELGSAEGSMTQFLVNDFKELTIVEGSKDLVDTVPPKDNLVKVHSLFEDFKPEKKYNTIIMEHILEHVDDPVGLLKKASNWLAKDGVLIAGVPNANSFHRLVAVKMDMLNDVCELNDRDHRVGHRRVYTLDKFKEDFAKSGLNVIDEGGVFFKPLSNKQIDDTWTDEMIDGFYELGKEFPQYAAEIFLVGKIK